jgi:hypothetical protein
LKLNLGKVNKLFRNNFETSNLNYKSSGSIFGTKTRQSVPKSMDLNNLTTFLAICESCGIVAVMSLWPSIEIWRNIQNVDSDALMAAILFFYRLKWAGRPI